MMQHDNKICSILWIIFLILDECRGGVQSSNYDKYNRRRCELIKVPMCQDMQYNYTGMPNWWKHYDQEQAAHAIDQFQPLIDPLGCSDKLKFFLCSTFTPMCSEDVDYGIVACRSVCEDVRKKCSPVLKDFGYAWPDALDCSKFPRRGKGHSEKLCMYPPEFAERDRKERLQKALQNSRRIVSSSTGQPAGGRVGGGGGAETQFSPGTHTFPDSDCQSTFLELQNHGGLNPQKGNCVQNCQKDIRFLGWQKRFAIIWNIALVSVCFISNLLAVLTFFLNRGRLGYPYRPIIFMSLSYVIHCVAYFCRWFLGAEGVSCVRNKRQSNCLYLIQSGIQTPNADICSVVFLLHYYSWIASAVWWVLLMFAVCLQLVRKFATEMISKYGLYFHAIGWFSPGIVSVAVLILGRIDGDELTGLCGVGLSDPRFMYFNIAPLTACLATGFVLCGLMCHSFCSMKRSNGEREGSSRSTCQTELTTTGTTATAAVCNTNPMRKFGVIIDSDEFARFEKRFLKIWIFSIIYILASALQLACLWLEKLEIERWDPYFRNCEIPPKQDSSPFVAFYAKIFGQLMSFVNGICVGLWIIFTPKTLEIWKDSLRQFCSCFKFFDVEKTPPVPASVQNSGGLECTDTLCPPHLHQHSHGPHGPSHHGSSSRRSPANSTDYRLRHGEGLQPQQRPLLANQPHYSNYYVTQNGVMAAMSQSSQDSRYPPIFSA